VVVLDGAGYSRENLPALEGFSWILRVPATLKEARACWKGSFREKLGPLCSRGTGGWRWRRTTGG
jgi:hypothetical protein